MTFLQKCGLKEGIYLLSILSPETSTEAFLPLPHLMVPVISAWLFGG